MRKSRILPLLVVALMLAAVTAVSWQSQTVAAQGENLLVNPGFEGAYSSFTPQTAQQQEACPVGVCTTAQMPNGWFPWWVSQGPDDLPEINRMPEYKPVCPFEPCPYPERVKSGGQAMQYFTFHSTHTAGAWQRVNVPANTNLRFSVWGQAWSSATDKVPSDFPTTVNMRIGIDPTGGTNPFSGDIVWSGVQNPYDVWVPFEVEATSRADAVTVFMWSAPVEARKHNDIYWDEAALTVGGGGSPAPASASGGGGGGGVAAPAAPAYVPGPTPTPNADGIILTQAQPGDTAWNLAARSGLSLDEFLDLNSMSRNDFIKVGEFYVTGSGDPGVPAPEEAPAEEPAAEEVAAESESEGETVAVADTADEAAADTAAPEGGVEPEEPAAEASSPVAAEESTDGEGASICLRAFEDGNRDGVFTAGEALRTDVAFTISGNAGVVSNYVTVGSEPFCVNGLESGTYRVTRSFATGEVATNAGDWALALEDGSNFQLDFGSYVDEAAAVAEAASDVEPEVAEVEPILASTDGALQEAAPESGFGVWIVGIIVAVAAVLLIGVIMVVLSARRVA